MSPSKGERGGGDREWRLGAAFPFIFFCFCALLLSLYCARALDRENSGDIAVDELLHLLNVDDDVRLDVSLHAPFSL